MTDHEQLDDTQQWRALADDIATALRSGRPASPTPEQVRALTAALEQRHLELQERVAHQVGPGPHPQRFWFTHVMKTGGTSLLATLLAQFGDRRSYPAPDDGDAVLDRPYATPWKLVEAFAHRGRSIRFVAGHLPHHARRFVGVPFTTITVLRDPVERTLSYLRQLRRESASAHPPSLEEIYDRPGPHQALLGNHMVKVFGLTGGDAATGVDQPLHVGPEHLPVAVEAVEAVDHLGLADRLDDLWRHLEDVYGWDLGPELRLNAAPVRDEAPASLVRRIGADTELDRALYEAARERYARTG